MERLRVFKIKTRSIQEGKALTKPRYPRKNFYGNKQDKSYLIGFRLGDLYVRKAHLNSPTIQINLNSTRSEQVELMKNLFAPFGHVGISRPDKAGATKVRAYVNCSFEFLVPKNKALDSWILKSKKNSIAFLAGYVDAEGSFGLSPRNQPFFSMKSQDKEIMKSIQARILPSVGIDTKLQFVRSAGSIMNNIRCNKDVYGIFIYNKQHLGLLLSALLPLLKHSKRRVDALKVFNRIK